MNKLQGTVKIYGTKLYSACGHAAVDGFASCPRCRIAKLEAEVERYKKWHSRAIQEQVRIGDLYDVMEEKYEAAEAALERVREENRVLHQAACELAAALKGEESDGPI